MALHWAETILATIHRKQELKDLFNADEFRLLFYCLWKRMFNFRSKKCSAAQNKGYFLTRMVTSNAFGEILKL